MQTGTTKTRHCCALALMLLLQACCSSHAAAPLAQALSPPATLAAPPTPLTSNYCVGRLALTTQETVHIRRNKAQFYWGELITLRETRKQYAHRLHAAVSSSNKNPLRERVLPPASFTPNDGLLLVLREHESLPLDPHVVTIEAYAHHDGTTFQYKKTALSRLQQTAQLRARQILQSVSGTPRPFTNKAPAPGFCLMHGNAMLAPLPGWFESNEIQGDFQVNGHGYHFSLRTQVLQSEAHNQAALENQRIALTTPMEVIEFLPSLPNTGTAEVSKDQISGISNISPLATEKGKRLLYEWYRPARAGDPFTPAIFFHIWPMTEASNDSADAAFLQWLRAQQGSSTPLFQIRANMPDATVPQRKTPAVQEESKLVYRTRLLTANGQAASHHRYMMFKNDKKVAEGRSDAQGFPEAQHADYYEQWVLRVMGD